MAATADIPGCLLKIPVSPAIPTGLATLKQLLITAGSLTDTDEAVPGIYSPQVAQATWNYITLIEDRSQGVHNPNYTKALLKNSIEALESLP